MTWLAEFLIVNGVTAALLALLAAGLGRFIRRPGIVHVLWVLVLLKLVTPPILRVGALPSLERWPPDESVLEETVPAGHASRARFETVFVEPSELGPFHRHGRPGFVAAMALWLTASTGIAGLLLTRAARFRRLVEDTPDGPLPLQEKARAWAQRIGLRRLPRLRLVPGRVPPMLWHRLGACELLLPVDLIGRLSTEELDALILHELAHLRRRDHWVRVLEVTVLTVFWWNPVVWWARRRLRIVEERACDAWVLDFSEKSRVYAEGILKTLDHLNGRVERIPALAMGATGTRQIEERLSMIMSRKRPKRMLPQQRWLLVGTCAIALAVFPVSGRPEAADQEPPPAPAEKTDPHALADLEREMLELELEEQRILTRRAELEDEIERETSRSNRDPGRRLAVELREAGRSEEARALERQLQEELKRRDAETRLERDLLERETGRLAAEAARIAELEESLEATEFQSQRTAMAPLARSHAELQAVMEELRHMLDQVAAELEATSVR